MVHLTTALEPGSGVPLYEQLYRSLAGEMRTGGLPAGTRMPGKRRLAAELSVSVNTVDTAYQMLAAEGYLAARERSERQKPKKTRINGVMPFMRKHIF